MTTHAASSQAGLASFAPRQHPQPVTIYAAVIEWPHPHDDADTEIVMERTPNARAAQVRQIIEEFAEDVDAPSGGDMAQSLAELAHLDGDEWIREARFYDLPFISTHERTV